MLVGGLAKNVPGEEGHALPTADELLGSEQAQRLHTHLSRAAGRPLPTLAAAVGQLDSLVLSARAAALADAALADLPSNSGAIATVREAAADPDFEGWLIWSAGLVAAGAALRDGGEEAFDEAMDVLALLTPRNTSEFSIRPLLAARPERALAIMRGWTGHEHPHVRRLASEGSRPLLPWGKRIPALVRDPELALPILDALRTDPDDYIYRSVANHLNDHSRAHPEWVLGTAQRWAGEGGGESAWVIKHALRTLVKAGNPVALELLGFGGASLRVDGPVLDAASVSWGGELALGARIVNDGAEPARLVVDYALHLQGSRGSGRRKVFKVATPTLAPGEEWGFERTFSFRPISTRVYYPGEHQIELLVNGASYGPVPFELLPPAL